MKRILLIINLLSLLSTSAQPFPLVNGKTVTDIYVDADDHSLVHLATNLFCKDIEMITGKELQFYEPMRPTKNLVIIGSVDRSPTIQKLVADKKLNADKIIGKWEAFQIEVVQRPFPGIERALVIAGSDRRGTAFGIFELSRQMGVSPWYWWADVPVKKKNELNILPGKFSDAPKVKYRGIFINDEAPALSNWSRMTFGGFNNKFYEKVFELILRLKGNYLWPAMWGNAFYDDDSLNIKMAENYGIVIGTSHHEPLMRAHDEWRRYGKGKWNYDSNEVNLKGFWKKGIQRATNEKIVTIGMRGDGDEPMSKETATALLETIVREQRAIIEEVTGRPAAETPQLWALYKEVQDYYDKGMRVPDDVTLLLCDDNWGNIRKLPKLNEPARKGGYGIYYHFDYVGGPRNYKWVNTNPIPRVWEQMHMAWEYKAREIWIVNVGDIKPMEFPISFFLDYAWNPEKIKEDDLQGYTERWAEAQFGKEYAVEIADIISKYSKYNGRRKPELLSPGTYSLTNYREADRIGYEYNQLLLRAEKLRDQLPAECHDAYFQLVLHPVKACANLNEMYIAAAYNKMYAEKKLAAANQYADKVKQLFIKDSLITLQYHTIAKGKWNHMMSQTHIGYTYWQQPPINKMPEVIYISEDSAKITDMPFDPEISASRPCLIARPRNREVFLEKDGYISIDASHFTKSINTNGVEWKILPDHGRTGSAVTPFPRTAPIQSPGANGPRLEYEICICDTTAAKIQLYFSPTLNFHNTDGLKYAISIDNETPQVFSLNKADNNVQTWSQWVANNIIIKTSNHGFRSGSCHTVKYWMVDPGVVLQKIVVDLGGLKPSYLGPPETHKTIADQ